jgi:hypothetical protein
MPADYPQPPDRPDEQSCCRRGCCPCIFDYYQDALARWEAQVVRLGGNPADLLARLGRER